MDLLYILGSGSKYNNDEIRYSLRSVEKNFKNIDRVVVVGENPGFLSDKVDYYFIKEAEGNKEWCIARKILTACESGIVKGDFLFMNDDFFFTREVDAEKYPYYCKGVLDEAPDPNYSKSLVNTKEYLKGQGKRIKHFDVHTPIIYNTEKFIGLSETWDYSKSLDFGLVVKSTYCNMLEIDSCEPYEDVKLNHLNEEEDFDRIFSTNCFSCTDDAWYLGVYEYLKLMYPNKSIYEQ